MHEFVYVYVLIYQKMFRKINYVLVAFSECSFVVGVRALFFTVHKVFSGQPTSIMGFSSTRTERGNLFIKVCGNSQGINYGDRGSVAFWGPQDGHNHFQMTLDTQLAVHLSRGHLNVSIRSSSKSFRHTDIRKTSGQFYNV